MSRDSNRFKLDPTIVALNSQTAGQNYGQVISQAFKDLGDIENNKINLQLADTKNQYEEIKLNSIKDELDDDKIFNSYLLADDKNEFLKNNKFKTSKYSLMGEDYKNSLSLQEQEGHVKSALTMFSDDKGNFNRNEAFSHLSKKHKEGVISEKQLYDIADSIDKRTQSGIYTPKTSMKDQLDIIKTKAEIRKINNDIANPRGAEYAPTERIKNYEYYKKDLQSRGLEPLPYSDWVNYENESRKLNGEANYNNIITDKLNKLSEKTGTANFENFDFNKAVEDGIITEAEKNDLRRSLAITNEGKTLERNLSKKISEYSVLGEQANRFASYANSKNIDTNVLQNAVDITKSYIPGFDLSEKELENFEFRSDLLNFSSTIMKIQSGLTVTDKERANFDKALGTLNKNKNVNFVGIKQQLQNQKAALNGQKDLAPEYFNIKYGHLVKNLDNSINIIDGYLGGDTNSNLILESVTGKPIPKGQPISSTMNNQNPPTQQNTNQPSWRDYE